MDDEPRNLQLVGSLLRQNGYRVRFASNGMQALESAFERPPDLILMDIMMPGMDGYDVCKVLHQDDRTREVPIVFLTAKAQTEEVVGGFEAGGTDYVTKPFRGRELLARLRTQLDLRRARQELKVANDQLKRVNEELKEVNENQMRFFSMIAHDLRSPFNGLRMFPQLLATRFDSLSREEIISIAQDVEDQVDNVHHFLEEMLEWCLYQRGEIQVNRTEFRLYDIVQTVAFVAESTARGKEITVNLDLSEDVLVFGDSKMISTVIQNLLSNAIKFSNRGGKVTIRAGYVDEENSVGVEVEDEGVGIRPKIKDNLFKLGKKTTTRGTEDERGTGFGLQLCHQFVTLHGGEIQVQSEINVGTTVYFDIPGRSLQEQLYDISEETAPGEESFQDYEER